MVPQSGMSAFRFVLQRVGGKRQVSMTVRAVVLAMVNLVLLREGSIRN